MFVRFLVENDYRFRGARRVLGTLALAAALTACSGDSDVDGGAGGGGGAGGAGGGGGAGGAGGGGGGAGGGGGGAEVQVPETYVFESGGESSVAYNGQAFRHVLIAALTRYVGGLTAQIDDGSLVPAAGDIVGALDFYYEFDVASAGGEPHGLSTDPAPKQATWADISASGANLKGKIAGNDPEGQHADWSTAFVGWEDPAVTTPESLVRLWFGQLEAAAIDRANGNIPTDPAGQPIALVQVTPQGQDLQQLLQKFLLGAVAFSQGADDYLDDDLEGKGLLSPNTPDGENPYTALAHGWDEGFGYFGAARDYGLYTDDEIAAADGRDGWKKGYHDTDGDGAIDLRAEFNFGHSTNAAKRDRGSNPSAPTDFTQGAWEAFLTGRAIIAAAEGPLTTEQLEALRAERDAAIENWEKAIAASAVHYINEVLHDTAALGTAEYSFADHAKHWSEMKGFALSFQFNPRSPLTDSQFAQLHEKLGQAPALVAGAEADAYKSRLLAARDLLKTAYGFAEANMGDANGEGGW